jgi:3-hydroxyisobutyrate dehydrogenase-like beta-hydroxyacid dehydrogenase
MSTVTIAMLHPGEMGSVVGACARAAGSRVVWASEGRGGSTAERARVAGLEDVGTLSAAVKASDVILSVCPPHAAVDVARAVAAEGFRGIFVDGNAVAPATAREIAEKIQAAGATFVDGGIIGPPPEKPGSTRLYLSGPAAPRVKALFSTGALEAIVVDGPAGAASAVKMAYASWTKGTSALLMAVRALAAAEGVDEVLLAEWARSQAGLGDRSESAVKGNAKKAWRFVGEMEEIAATYAAAGLPDGFHRAAGQIYERLSAFKDTKTAPPMTEVARILAQRKGRTSDG